MSQAATHAFNLADYIIIGAIVLSAFISLARGFLSEAISLLTWVIAAIIAFKGATFVANLLKQMIQTSSLRILVGFLILFILVLIIGSIINHLMTAFILKSGLTGTNRLLGMIFGFARGILLVAIFILFARYTSMVKQPWWQSSQIIPYFMGITDWLQQFLPVHLKNFSHLFAYAKSGNT